MFLFVLMLIAQSILCVSVFYVLSHHKYRDEMTSFCTRQKKREANSVVRRWKSLKHNERADGRTDGRTDERSGSEGARERD